MSAQKKGELALEIFANLQKRGVLQDDQKKMVVDRALELAKKTVQTIREWSDYRQAGRKEH